MVVDFILMSLAVTTGLALFQFVVLPISAFIEKVSIYAEDKRKPLGERPS